MALKPGRTGKGTFKKGTSGNPTGRPKGFSELSKNCRDYMSVKGFKKLTDLADKPSKDQRAALELILAYGYGKPTQKIAGDDSLSPIKVAMELPKEELDKLAKFAFEEDS